MALANNLSTLFFIILFALVFLLNLAVSRCPKRFNCGNITALEFPLAMEPECGLFLVDGCDSPENPRVQFVATDTWYDLLQKYSTNKFLIRSPDLQRSLLNQSCSPFFYMLPKPPFASVSISPNYTFFQCFNLSADEDIQRQFGNYYSKTCPSFNVYYTDRSVPRESGLRRNCGAFELPIKLGQDPRQVYDLLTSEFTIEWNVSEDCYECQRRNGQCLSNNMNELLCRPRERSQTRMILPMRILVTVGAVAMVITLVIFFHKKQRAMLRLLGLGKAETQEENVTEAFLRNHGNLAQKRYKYSDLKKITNSFKDTLGKGGYGSVYKGKLPDGCPVAVKILNESKGNGEEFINEVASISRTSHVNIVTLLGFCFEGSKSALIYEFVPNGSLDKFLPGENSTTVCSLLELEKLFEIAVGIARGLEYLHKGCTTRILHFDIKPQNILLDENLNPKISDFGLARLCPNRSSIVSMLGARGTIGYIAPEVFCRNYGEVSHKADVYSYGMMVLEMVVGRQPNVQGDRSTDMYFPDWIYKNLEENNINVRIVNEEDHNGRCSRKMIIVGLWCIQTEPKNRPPINRVVEMLEGSVEVLEIPPKPVLSSPPRLATAAAAVAASSSGEQISVRD